MTSDPSAEGAIHSHAFQSIIHAMPQSLSKVIIHTIFSTKNREPSLDSATRPRMTPIWRQSAAIWVVW